MDDGPGTPDVVGWLRDGLYTTVGLAVLGVQQAQVHRRDLQRELARFAIEVQERVDPLLDDIEARLPDDLRPLLAGARSAARDVQRSLLGRPAG